MLLACSDMASYPLARNNQEREAHSTSKAPPRERRVTWETQGMSIDQLHPTWREALAAEFDKPYFKKLQEFVTEQRANHTVFPPEDEVFSAFGLAPLDEVKVFLLGQDPYHGVNQAHGLCFSVKPGIRIPPSLRNIYKELASDIGCEIPKHGYLTRWAEQGMLMINAVLTVRQAEANSHKSKGWEKFTNAAIKAVNAKESRVVFILWGGYARKKKKLITGEHHVVIESAHPSPLSAKNGFFGSKPFSQTNAALEEAGLTPIDWQLPMEV